ncbi:MAG: hypothetical protein ACRBDI_06385 [Alphaproteobacteria bacterium]
MCVISTFISDTSGWIQNWFMINLHIFISLLMHQLLWFDWTFWQQYLLPAFQMMGNQLSAVGTQQVMAVGMFMDAKNQMETQRLMQELQAQAHKDYHPSRGMCEFGTRIQSLAASERKGEINSLLLSERSLDRYLGAKSTYSAMGSKEDVVVRLGSFRDVYCDAHDNGGTLDVVCPNLVTTTQPERDRLNNDIDYQGVLENPWTLDVDLTNSGTATDTEEDIIALSDNLYGYKSFSRIGKDKIKNGASVSSSEVQEAYMDMRALIAKIKVAENSFNALVSMKSEGTDGSREFIESYLEELGIPDNEVDDLLGDNPSYYAQMEVLTKKAYQTPLFYTNLYDKPANIDRKEVAIQAVGLIQKFDLWKSYLRTEASLSILLELTVEDLQREVEDNILALNPSGKVR